MTERIRYKPVEQFSDVHSSPEGSAAYLARISSGAPYRGTFLEALALDDPNVHRVLDVGCGAGGNTINLARALPNIEFLGIDIEASLIDHIPLEDRPINCTLETFDITRPDAQNLRGNPFDRVVVERVLQWISEVDIRKAMDNIVNATSTGGYVAVAEPHWGELAIDGMNDEETKVVLAHIGSRVPSPHVGGEIGDLLADSGLKDIEVRRLVDAIPAHIAIDILKVAESAQVALGERAPDWIEKFLSESEPKLVQIAMYIGRGKKSI